MKATRPRRGKDSAVRIRHSAFGTLVRKWREDRQLSRADAARKLGVPYRTLEDWEAGKRTPRGIAKWLILDKLGMIKKSKSKNLLTKASFQKLLNAKWDQPKTK